MLPLARDALSVTRVTLQGYRTRDTSRTLNKPLSLTKISSYY
jgi:hypothetical protein